MVSILSLFVAILAVLFSPSVVWAVATRQLKIGAREKWMSEFRDQAAALLTAYDKFLIHAKSYDCKDGEKKEKLSNINEVKQLHYNTLCLFIAERNSQYDHFTSLMDQMLNSETTTVMERRNAFVAEAGRILKIERDTIINTRGILPELWISLWGSKATV